MVVPETEIVVTQDGAEVVRKTVRPGDYVIGRDGSCDVAVASDTVSERHAQLTINFDYALIEDLGSDSGTFVNGQRVTTATRLWPSQKIQVGAATITLRRKRMPTDSEQSLAPQTEVVRRLLPEEILREQKYDIGGQIAQGGMGAILSAKEIAIRREVAMKVMLGSGGQEDLLRFVEEAQITGQLEHPNIVPVHELSVDENDQVFYTMKLVRGVTLRQVLEQLAQGDAEAIKKYPLSALLTVFQKVCDAVAFAHSRGVIHRDLKPDNIMLGDFGEVLVMDWGLGKRMKDEGGRMKQSAPSAVGNENPNAQSAPSSSSFILHPSSFSGTPLSSFAGTLQGSIMGTPQYMAPEQARGEIDALDARSDIYALGAILYHILTLHPPVEGANVDEILAKVSAGQFIPPIQRAQQARPHPSAPAPAPLPKPEQALPHAGDPDAPTLVHEEGPVAAPLRRGAATERRGYSSAGPRPLPHLPGGSVPESLNAVVLKAMALDQTARYQTIAELQADLTAYQTGFATRAEHASLTKQLVLLVKRHKGAFTTAAAAWFIITALAVWFIVNIRASERKATHNAEIAAANEQKAIAEQQNTRRALAKAQIALAEGAFREENGPAMQAALNAVPEDLRDSNWGYLVARADTSLATIKTGRAKDSDTRSVAANPTQPGIFAVGFYDGEIRLVKATGETLAKFEAGFSTKVGYSNPVLAFSPDGERIATGRRGVHLGEGADGIVILSARDGRKILELAAPPSRNLQFDHAGQRLLQVVNAPGQLKVWDAVSGQLLWETKPDNNVRATFDPQGKFIAMFSERERFRILDARDGTLVRNLPNIANGTAFLVMHPDGAHLFSGDTKGSIREWDMLGKTLFEIHASDHQIADFAFTKDGDRFVTLANDAGGKQSLQVWRTNGGKHLQTLMGGSGEAFGCAVHPLSGELLVCGRVTKSWGLTNSPVKWTSNQGLCQDPCFWGDDDWLFAPASASQIGLFDLSAADPSKPIWKSKPGFNVNTISGDGNLAAIGHVLPNATCEYHFLEKFGRMVDEKQDVYSGRFRANLLCMNYAGDRLAVFRDGAVVDRSGRELRRLFPKGPPELQDAAWIGSTTRMVSLITAHYGRGVPGSEEQIILSDAETGQQLLMATYPTAMDCLAVSPDGKTIAEAGLDKMVRLRDAETLAVKKAFRAHDDGITALAFHPTRPILATGSNDLTVKLWNLETGKQIEELRGAVANIERLKFSPSGKRLAAKTGIPGPVLVWEPESLNPH